MAGFPRSKRFLSKDCVLLIHERRLTKTIELSGPLGSNVQVLKENLSQLETGIALEREGFRRLAKGSSLALEDLCKRAARNWYVRAEEALELGLVAGLF
jgi:hypothetical protein